LFSQIQYGSKLDLSGDISDFTNEDNIRVTLQAIREADVCIIAIGSIASTYRKVAIYQNQLFDLLRNEEFEGKLFTISAPDGSEQLHPLSGKLRAADSWKLVAYELPVPPPTEKETTETLIDTDNAIKLSKTRKGNK